MKKLLLILGILFLTISCNDTSIKQNMQMLQTKYPKAILYKINSRQYIIIDSVKIYDVAITNDGKIESIVKIK